MMKSKCKVGQRVTFKDNGELLDGTVLSVNWEFTIVKFDTLQDISLLKENKIFDLILVEDVVV